MRVQAQPLQKGDIVSSGEKVLRVQTTVNTPKGKIHIQLDRNGSDRWAEWGKYTIIGVTRPDPQLIT